MAKELRDDDNDPGDAQQKLVVHALARVMWGQARANDDPKLGAEESKALWLKEKEPFIKSARQIARRLQKRGFRIMQTHMGNDGDDSPTAGRAPVT